MDIVYSCGLCGESCDIVSGHPCVAGYSNYILDESNCFYPCDADGTIAGSNETGNGLLQGEEESLSHEGDTENIPETQHHPAPNKGKYRTTTPLKKLTDYEIDILILEVQKREPLWKFSLPLQDRSRETVKKLWDQVSLALGGKLTGTEAREKFKSLKDRYRKIVQSEQHASGSAAQIGNKEQWKYYNSMEFLRDSCLIRTTATNVDHEIVESQQVEEADEFTQEFDDANSIVSASIGRTKSRKRESENASTAIVRIADALCRDKVRPTVALPASPQMDEVDCLLHAAGLQLRRLRRRTRIKTLMDILNIINDKVEQEENETPLGA